MIERDDPQDLDLAGLYREVSMEQPSTGLDARILAAARATAAPAGVAKPSWVNRWKFPVVLATVAVMTTTITLLVQDKEAGRLDVPDTPLPKQRTAPAPAAEPPGASEPAAAPAPKPLDAPRKEAARRPAAQPATREKPTAAKAENAAPRLSRSIGSVSEDKKAAPSAPAADELRSGSASGAAIKDQTTLEKAQPRMKMQAAPARRADSAERETARPPEEWIADIRRLRLEGRRAEAEASLAEFRRRYPDYALPEDLKQP